MNIKYITLNRKSTNYEYFVGENFLTVAKRISWFGGELNSKEMNLVLTPNQFKRLLNIPLEEITSKLLKVSLGPPDDIIENNYCVIL